MILLCVLTDEVPPLAATLPVSCPSRRRGFAWLLVAELVEGPRARAQAGRVRPELVDTGCSGEPPSAGDVPTSPRVVRRGPSLCGGKRARSGRGARPGRGLVPRG